MPATEGENNETPFGVVSVESGMTNEDGSYIKLSLLMTGGKRLHLAIPVGEVSPMIAMLSRGARDADAISGRAVAEALVAETAEARLDENGCVLRFHLADGFDFLISLPIPAADGLRNQLSASLAGGTPASPGTPLQ